MKFYRTCSVKPVKPLTIIIAALTGLFLLPAFAEGPVEKKLCVFDPGGSVGDAYQMMVDFQAAALDWGVRFDLQPFTDELKAVAAFNEGKCHAVLLTGLRARTFNRFSSTVEAMGAVPDYDTLKRVISALANPRAARRMVAGEYETAAIFPAGSVYLFLRDRANASVESLEGKKIATMEFDQAAPLMVERVKAVPVDAEVGTFAGMFNEGKVDACYSPATAFKPLELEKGVRDSGGLVRFSLSQLTLQLIIRHDKMPEDFGNQSRRYAASRYDRMMGVVRRAESGVPENYWINVPSEELAGFEDVFRSIRIELRDKNVYDGSMMTFLRRIRCQIDESRPECTDPVE